MKLSENENESENEDEKMFTHSKSCIFKVFHFVVIEVKMKIKMGENESE